MGYDSGIKYIRGQCACQPRGARLRHSIWQLQLPDLPFFFIHNITLQNVRCLDPGKCCFLCAVWWRLFWLCVFLWPNPASRCLCAVASIANRRAAYPIRSSSSLGHYEAKTKALVSSGIAELVRQHRYRASFFPSPLSQDIASANPRKLRLVPGSPIPVRSRTGLIPGVNRLQLISIEAGGLPNLRVANSRHFEGP